jgi:hypothetical protein
MFQLNDSMQVRIQILIQCTTVSLGGAQMNTPHFTASVL